MAFIVSHREKHKDVEVWQYCSPMLWYAHLAGSATLFFGACEAILQFMVNADTHVSTIDTVRFRFRMMKLNSVVLALLITFYFIVYTFCEINICAEAQNKEPT